MRSPAAASAAPAVLVENLTVSHRQHPAVHHLNCRIDAGTLTAIVGPNGAGKSSLLDAMVGRIAPSTGRIRLGVPGRAQVAYLPQQTQIDRSFPLRVNDVVMLGAWPALGPFGGAGAAVRRRAAEAIAQVGMAGLERRLVGELSVGQFQRVLFARVLLQDAPLILLDEPFNAIDARTTADLLALVHRWHHEGRTVVAVLHDLDQVRRHFPQALLLAREAIAFGPTADVLTNDNLQRARALAERWDDAAAWCHRDEPGTQRRWGYSAGRGLGRPARRARSQPTRRAARPPMSLTALLIDPFTEFGFMRRALVATLALGLSCGPVGTLLVLRRMSLVGDAVAHALLPGAAVGFVLFGFSLSAMSIGGMVAALLVAGLAGLVARMTPQREDASFAAFYLIALAAGVMIISTRGSSVDLMHVLFGSVLAVDDDSLYLIAAISSLSLLLLALVYRPLVVECFDPGFLRSLGRAGGWVHGIFLLLLVLNLVAGFQALGTLMAVGLMMLPATAARFWAAELWGLAGVASLIAMVSGAGGLLLSFHFEWPSGPAIVLLAGVFYLASLLVGTRDSLLARLRGRRAHREL